MRSDTYNSSRVKLINKQYDITIAVRPDFNWGKN